MKQLRLCLLVIGALLTTLMIVNPAGAAVTPSVAVVGAHLFDPWADSATNSDDTYQQLQLELVYTCNPASKQVYFPAHFSAPGPDFEIDYSRGSLMQDDPNPDAAFPCTGKSERAYAYLDGNAAEVGMIGTATVRMATSTDPDDPPVLAQDAHKTILDDRVVGQPKLFTLPPGPVSQTSVVRTATTLRINWSPPVDDHSNLPVIGYVVARDGSDTTGGGKYSTLVSASTRSFTFTLLHPASIYHLTVTARNTDAWTGGMGTPSTVQVETLAHDPTPPAPPKPAPKPIKQTVSARWSPARLYVGHVATLTGRVSPVPAHRSVVVQRYYSGAWHSVATVAVSSAGAYSYRFVANTATSYPFRVVKAAETGRTTGISPTVRVAYVAVPRYANCTSMHRSFGHGVGKPGAHDHGSRHPDTHFYANSAGYALNVRLDRDHDGIACEA